MSALFSIQFLTAWGSAAPIVSPLAEFWFSGAQVAVKELAQTLLVGAVLTVLVAATILMVMELCDGPRDLLASSLALGEGRGPRVTALRAV
jgi:hypothetical protein